MMWDPLFKAAVYKDIEKVRRLLQDGHDPNCRGRVMHQIKDLTPLMVVLGNSDNDFLEFAKRPHFEIVQMLLSGGAEVNLRDDHGMTALHHNLQFFIRDKNASREDKVKVTEELIKAGANVNAEDRYKNTPLILASENSDGVGSVRLLLQAGANVNATSDGGSTPLIRAACSDSGVEIIEELIRAGADVNAKNDKGLTALANCVEDPGDMYGANDVSSLMALLDNGANPMVKGKDGVILSKSSQTDKSFKPILIAMEKKLLFSKKCVGNKGLQYACKQAIFKSFRVNNRQSRNQLKHLKSVLPLQW